jgi:hypothetical protein
MRDPRSALAEGDLHTDNIPVLENFDRAFLFDAEALERARKRYQEDSGHANVHVSAATPFVFRYLLEEAFVGGVERVETLHVHVIGTGEYTVRFGPDEMEVAVGCTGDPTARLVTSRDTFGGMTLFKVMSASALSKQREDELAGRVGHELQDHQLAQVAGGKGSGDWSCGREQTYGCWEEIVVCGGNDCHSEFDPCYQNNCGADCAGNYCAGDFCGVDGGCGAEGGGGSGCGSDACGAAGCLADGCAAAACGGDGCAAAVCGGEMCGAAACYGETCGAAACAADACGAAICGADIAPFDGCIVDACLVNIIPIVPIV